MNATDDTPTSQQPDNPFEPETPDGPFTGREAVLARIHRHLTDAPRTAPLAVTGRPKTGKTALLRRFMDTDENIIGIYVAVPSLPLYDEPALLSRLSQMMVDAVQERGFVPDPHVRSPDRAEMRGWLREECLPALYRAIWRRRRIALLLDDADSLLDALAAGRLPDDFPAYLRGLLGAQFGVALALNDADTDRLGPLVALMPPENVVRLGSLSVAEVASLCARWLAPCTETLALAVHASSGGEPLLVHRLGHALYERRRVTNVDTLSAEDAKAVSGAVYAASKPTLRRMWDDLDGDERRVLTAISQLRYADPLRRVDTPGIEAWLVQTDTPMDTTGINAALRGLEYRELVSGAASAVTVSGGLMQRWLVEHVDDTGTITARVPVPGITPEGGRRLLIAAVAAAVLLVLLVMVVSLSGGGAESGDDSVPTVTLVPPES